MSCRAPSVLDRLPDLHEAADPFDAWLLALADTSGADYLVTGDKRSGLLARRRVAAARILTASLFCKVIG